MEKLTHSCSSTSITRTTVAAHTDASQQRIQRLLYGAVLCNSLLRLCYGEAHFLVNIISIHNANLAAKFCANLPLLVNRLALYIQVNIRPALQV